MKDTIEVPRKWIEELIDKMFKANVAWGSDKWAKKQLNLIDHIDSARSFLDEE